MNLIEYMQEEGIRLERRGMSWWCSCPFHKDDTPSLQVSERDGKHVWYCFSCKRGGGPAGFVAEHLGIPEWAGKKKWAEMTGGAAPDPGRETLTRAVELLAVNGHPFLRDRGISDETCRLYGIGYCEDYGSFLKRAGLSADEARRVGLFDFSNSMVYPFFDHDGCYKVAARRLDVKDYQGSPRDSEFWREGLWGLHRFRGQEAWIFEGYHDAMMARQHGYEALAASGTQMSKAAWQELRDRNVTRVVFVPDGDEGGRSWLARLSTDAPEDFLIEFVHLASGDPDEALSAGADFRGMVITPFEWFMSTMPSGTLAERVRAVKASAKVFARMPKYQRSMARAWYADRYGDDESLDYLTVDVEPDYEAERVVLANCLYSRNVRLETLQALEERHFSSKAHRSLYSMIREADATPQMVQVQLGMDLSDHADLMNYRFYLDRVKSVGDRLAVSKMLASADLSNVGELVEGLYRVVDHAAVSEASVVASRVIDDLNRRVAAPSVPGIQIQSFPTINKVLLGLVPGRLLLVSGNSGHGKTTTVCNILNEVIDEHKALFVSLEMTEDEIVGKLISIRSGVPSIKTMTGSLEQFEYDKVLEAAQSVGRSGLRVIFGVNDLHKIVAIVKANAMQGRARVVVIDYLQLVSVPSREERWEQLARITKTLKTQVCPLGVTVIAITQLKRSALNSDVPDASEQAGAYAMLNDADAAITVRKVDPKDTKDGSNYLLYLSKNRFGLDEVQVPCLFDRTTQRIKEVP